MAFLTASYTVATLAEALHQWKEDMVAAGAYTVASSSDGTTYNPSGDQVTGSGSGAGGFDNDSAWMRLVAADGKREILLQRAIGDSDLFNGWFSFGSVPFTGGSPDATTVPTATNAVQFGFSSFFFALPGGSYALTTGVDDAPPYSTYLTFTDSGAPIFGLMFDGIDATDDPAIAHVLDYFGQIFEYGPIYAAPYAWNTLIDRLDVAGGGGGAVDATPPTITGFDPTTGSSLLRTASIAVDVADGAALGAAILWGELADGTRLLVYDGSAFVGIFAASSTLSSGTYTIVPDAPGWPSSSVVIHVYAVDTSGNDASATASYTISDAPAAPTVGPFSPSDGGNTTRTGTVTIDVTDDEGRTALALVTIDVALADGKVITAYNGSAFPGPLSAGSARSNITNGYRYSIVHGGAGWPSSTLAYRVTATDAQGRTTTHTTYNLVITDPPAAPVIGSWSPSAGEVSRTDNVDFTVAAPDGFASIVVWAVLGDGTTVVVYDGSAFGAQVNAASSVSGTTTKSFSITFDGAGWTDDYTLKVRATDTLGQTSTATQAYTLSDAPAPDVADVEPPTVSFAVASGTTIKKTDAVAVEVADETELALVLITASYPSGAYEVIYETPSSGEGSGFAPFFVGSSKSAITGGWRFRLVRTGGWPGAPTIKVRPFDRGLNEG